MNSKYSLLIKILDDIRQSATRDLSNLYNPPATQSELIVDARSRALLHLYLMVECGIDEDDFRGRERLICDGPQDGGLDAYFIDVEQKRVLLIQSKFRATDTNFETVSIKADALVKTEFDRITQGHQTDSRDQRFNSKVRAFQRQLQKVSGLARFEFVVVLLANSTQYTATQMKRLVGNHKFEIFDGNKVYERLAFPVCQGTYFNPGEISIRVPLSRNEVPRLKQSVNTSAGPCDITVIYVPTIEIGKQLLKYKNAILEYNPRNYLSLQKSPKSVNPQIAASITNLTTNDFAILNNGITIMAEDCSVTDYAGRKNVGMLTMINPQIINGGQTAYTLSQIYSDNPNTGQFRGKEVMLKIVTLKSRNGRRHEFIGLISNATNQQNPVQEADRRSNSPTLEALQEFIFREFGYFFERKRGEFFNGSKKGFMNGQHIINRAELVRAWYAYSGMPTSARKSETALFNEKQLSSVLPNAGPFRQVFLAYLLLQDLKKKQKLYKKGLFKCVRCVNAFSYGRYAVVAAAGRVAPTIKPRVGVQDIERIADNSVSRVLGKWSKFERFAKSRTQNKRYFNSRPANFDNYYKGNTVDNDLAAFAW